MMDTGDLDDDDGFDDEFVRLFGESDETDEKLDRDALVAEGLALGALACAESRADLILSARAARKRRKTRRKNLTQRWVRGKHGINDHGDKMLQPVAAASTPRTKKAHQALNTVAVNYLASRKEIDGIGGDEGSTSNAGCSAGQVEKELKMLCEHTWDGKIANDYRMEGLHSGFLSERLVLRAIDLAPAKINLGALDVLFAAAGKRTVRGEHARDNAIPSSSSVSKLRKLLNVRGRELFGLNFDALETDNSESREQDEEDDEEEEEESAVEDPNVLKQFWRFDDIVKFVRVVMSTYDVGKSGATALLPLLIKLSNDGAPTSKLAGCCALTLTMCDPRCSTHVRHHPQSPRHVFPIAGFFDKETKVNLHAAFMPIYQELLALEATGDIIT